MPYEETSALDGDNIEKAFEKIAFNLVHAASMGIVHG